MLINKGFTTGDVVSIKLINGDEIISRFESEDVDTISISRPLALTMSGQGLGMIPYMFLAAKDTITIKQQFVMVIAPAKKDAADQYLTGTTGIALA